MSRLGKKPIKILDKTEVKISADIVTVKGPKGELSMPFLSKQVSIEVKDSEIIVNPLKTDKESLSLWGTYSSILINLMKGVTEGYEKRLIIEGVGFKADAKPDKVTLNIGFSHPVELKIPKGISVAVEKDNIIITGIDKQAVGEFAATIRAKKKPEPYKGKGIRYSNEVIRRKEGKKAA
jgi:large subunit ribosomal protein L6